MTYLLVENDGVAPLECFTTLGVSTSRKDSSAIGQFGSGSKHSVALLLRKGLFPIICCGNLKLEFYSEPKMIDDGLSKQEFNNVMVKMSGKTADGKNINKIQALGFTLEFGELDWTEVEFAMREFVSNSLDRSIREFGEFSGHMDVRVVDNVRTMAGVTRVYVPFENDVKSYYMHINKRFLHFIEPELLDTTILAKNYRAWSESGGAMIYKKGVFVRQLCEDRKDSLYDYNFKDELRLDECRNSDDYAVKAAISKALCQAPSEILCELFKKLTTDENFQERHLDGYDVRRHAVQRNKDRWKAAWELCFGAKAVHCPDIFFYDRLVRKGYRPIMINCWAKTFRAMGIPTHLDLLDEHEVSGLDFSEAPKAMEDAYAWCKDKLISVNLWHPREGEPVLAQFTATVKEGSTMRTFYANGKLAVNSDIAGSEGPALTQAVLESTVCFLTGSTPMSADNNDFLLRAVVGGWND